jgi:hypothetical protein
MTLEENKHAFQIAEKLSWSNARIKSTFLGIEDHGIMTGVLQCEGECWSQGFGCRSLEEAEILKDFVRGAIAAIRVESWEGLQGKLIRVGKPIDGGHSDNIVAIRPIVDVGPIYLVEKLGDIEPGVYK